LQQEYEQAYHDETTAESSWYDACDRSASHECFQLCSLMYQKLPAELRDIVYKYLCIEDRPIPAGPYYHFRHYGYGVHSKEWPTALANAISRGRTKVDHTQRPDPDIVQPWSHVLHPAYMSFAIASETQKVYFANNTFSLCNVERGIASFLEDDNHRRPYRFRGASLSENAHRDTTSNVGPEPKPLDLVRKLQIRIKCEHAELLLKRELFATSMATYREVFANECDFLRLTRNSLEPLLYLPQQERPLELEFVIMTTYLPREVAATAEDYSDQHRLFINILQALRNTVYKLMYDCGNTTIKIIQHDELLSPFPRNLTALWSLSKEQWEHVCLNATCKCSPLLTLSQEKSANHGRVVWDADFYLACPGMSAEETHGRFQGSEALALLRERWGISDAFRENRPKWPIVEGRYWPVGNGPPGCWW
jgi:hypothetical protein